MKKRADFMIRAALLLVGVAMLAGGGALIAQGEAPGTAVMFLLAGAGMLAALVRSLAKARAKRRRREEILLTGHRVRGAVTGCRNASVRINGRHGQIVTVRVKTPAGREIMAETDPIWDRCPEAGTPADVIFDPADEHLYVIELAAEK